MTLQQYIEQHQPKSISDLIDLVEKNTDYRISDIKRVYYYGYLQGIRIKVFHQISGTEFDVWLPKNLARHWR